MVRDGRPLFVGVLRVLTIVALTLAALSLVSLRPVAAQQGPDCEDPDTVACLPTGGMPQPAPQPSPMPSVAPAPPPPAAAAAAAPVRYPICPPVPPPYPPPGPPLPLGAGSAAPIPAPIPTYPCFSDIYGTINRANLAYARAMRSLDISLLTPYWGQDALQQVVGQIGSLQAAGSYRVLRLKSIQVLEQAISPGYAWVHTSEHWTTATWSFDGYQYDAGDAWYDNQYYLYRVGGRWVIGTDIVN